MGGEIDRPYTSRIFLGLAGPGSQVGRISNFSHILQEKNIQTSYFTPFQKAGRAREKNLG